MHERWGPTWKLGELPQLHADALTLAVIGAATFAFVCYCVYRVYRQMSGRR